MCGIAGIVSITGRPVDPESLRAMCDTLAHRGPDDAGYAFLNPGAGDRDEHGRGSYWLELGDPRFASGADSGMVMGSERARREFEVRPYTVAMGHRRLAILDPSPLGHQPMSTTDKRVWLTHNGEIYNFKSLRERLRSRGYHFRSGSDAEVLCWLWDEQGEACLPELDGMFAFATYDRWSNTFSLARDRFGVKPVYYAMSDDRSQLVYASEAKAIFASGLVTPRLSPDSLVEYMTFQNIFGSRSIWSGIQLLPPGGVLSLTPNSGAQPRVRIHSRAVHGNAPMHGPQTLRSDEVAERFEAAVERQLVSDVTVGSYLSGGMDSGSIVAIAGRRLGRLHTFTGGFDLTNVNGIEQGFDERALAEKLSYLLQTEHYSVVLHAGDMPAAMERIGWHMDDPRVGMCHQNWYVAKLASRFVKVCLAGTGGDELFGGYPWRYRGPLSCPDEASFADALFASWNRLLPPDELAGLLSPDLHPRLGVPRASFDAALGAAPEPPKGTDPVEARLQKILAFEFNTFLQGLLITDDHVSMAHGLEIRVPFLDNDLNDLSWSLSPAQKVRVSSLLESNNGHLESTDGKMVLRKAMEKYLPEEFVRQRKQGFSPPDANWYRGPSMSYIREVLLDKRALERPWFRREEVERRLNEHFDGQQNHRLLIWSMLSLEWIQRHFVDQSVHTTPAQAPLLRRPVEVSVPDEAPATSGAPA